MAPTSTKQRRAIGIFRVSQVNGREGDSFASPAEQRDRIEAACERDGLTLLRIEDEANVSGGQVERLIAREALASVGIRRLMTVPGVNVIVAASFMAAIGDIHRFPQSAQTRRLFGSGPARAPARQRPRQPRPDLQAGVGARPPRVPASSRACSGCCSPAKRTTPAPSRR